MLQVVLRGCTLVTIPSGQSWTDQHNRTCRTIDTAHQTTHPSVPISKPDEITPMMTPEFYRELQSRSSKFLKILIYSYFKYHAQYLDWTINYSSQHCMVAKTLLTRHDSTSTKACRPLYQVTKTTICCVQNKLSHSLYSLESSAMSSGLHIDSTWLCATHSKAWDERGKEHSDERHFQTRALICAVRFTARTTTSRKDTDRQLESFSKILKERQGPSRHIRTFDKKKQKPQEVLPRADFGRSIGALNQTIGSTVQRPWKKAEAAPSFSSPLCDCNRNVSSWSRSLDMFQLQKEIYFLIWNLHMSCFYSLLRNTGSSAVPNLLLEIHMFRCVIMCLFAHPVCLKLSKGRLKITETDANKLHHSSTISATKIADLSAKILVTQSFFPEVPEM